MEVTYVHVQVKQKIVTICFKMQRHKSMTVFFLCVTVCVLMFVLQLLLCLKSIFTNVKYFYSLEEPILQILYGAKTVFSRWAITPPKVN